MSDPWLTRQLADLNFYARDSGRGRFTTAAICRKGHIETTDMEQFGGQLTKFCTKCGTEVLAKCQECGTPIHGHFVPPGVTAIGGVLRAPAYCHQCGKAYPWTAEQTSAAKELADDLENVTPEDLAKIKTALDDIAVPGPRAEAGAARLKKLLKGAGTDVGRALWKLSVDIASEAAKKIMLGQ